MKRSLAVAVLVMTTVPTYSQQNPPAVSPDGLAPLLGSVPADLVVPALVPDTGRAETRGARKQRPATRVRQVLPNWKHTDVYHTLYLPSDYDASRRFPLIVEFAGNGGYRNSLGDVCTGVPEGSRLGYGITAGKGFIWVCLPFVRENRSQIATRWWGDAPSYDVAPTIDYCKEAVAWICKEYNADANRVILAGFSRGAIACNFIGLHDDDVSSLWCGFIAYSHYDGVRRWPYGGSDRASALLRLGRLGGRPQLICHEQTPPNQGLSATRNWLESTGIEGDFTYVETGFRNHNDAWVLRPSPARNTIRSWLDRFR